MLKPLLFALSVLTSLSACSSAELKRVFYYTGENISCQQRNQNLPTENELNAECGKPAESYEEYEKRRQAAQSPPKK